MGATGMEGCFTLDGEIALSRSFCRRMHETADPSGMETGSPIWMHWHNESSEADCEEVISEKSENDDEESGKRSVPNIVETLTILDNICQCPELDN